MNDAIDFAIVEYTARAPRDTRGKVILSDATRQEVAEQLHVTYPGWHETFSLDTVERAVWNAQR